MAHKKPTCPFAMHRTNSKELKMTESVVAMHVRYFSQADDTVTWDTMKKGHDKQSITKGVWLKLKTITNILFGKTSSVATLSEIHNPASTGLWDKDGNFDEKLFAQLAVRHIKVDDKKVITREIFENFRNEIHGNCTDFGTATKVGYLLPVPWKAVTDGSINELYEYYSDIWVKNKNGKYEKALTVDQLRAFYTDPVDVMQRREKGEFQTKEPK
jgi:hypothetical protein